MDYRYNAFISYRHLSPDQEIAGRLHSYIENFAIPSSLKKSLGIRKMGRVFRDQEELQISASLGDDIHEALDSSEWLICICSPGYLESAWCMEELRYFIDSGRRDHVLAVLTEGEPSDSFPDIIRLKEVNGETVDDDPLAADVRGASLSEQLAKLKSEKLRIMAALLGVRYDDLRQRARQRRSRMIMAAGAAVIVLLSGFLGFAFHKNSQITAERNSALIAESKWLAQSADEALDNGDKMLSLLLSLEALPKDFDDPERPVTEEALESLRSAIISGYGDNQYVPCTEITVPGLETFRGYNNTLLCFSRQSDGYVTGWNMQTGQETDPGIRVSEEPEYLVFAYNGKCFCVYPDRITMSNSTYTDHIMSDPDDPRSYITLNKTLETGEKGIHYTLSEGGNGDYVLVERYQGAFSGTQWYAARYRDYSWLGDDLRVIEAKPVGDTRYFLLLNNSSRDLETPDVLNVASSYDENNVEKVYTSTTLREDDDFYIRVCIDVSCEGTVFAVDTYNTILFWNINDTEPSSVIKKEMLDGSSVMKIAYSPTENSVLAAMTNDGKIFLIDCVLGEVTEEISAGLANISDFMWNSDGSRILATCDDGRARLISIVDTQIIQTFDCGFQLEKAVFACTDNFDNSLSDRYILLVGGDRIKTFALDQDRETTSLVGRNGALITNTTYGYDIDHTVDISFTRHRVALSPDGKTVWCCRNADIYAVDTETMEIRASSSQSNAQSLLEVVGDKYIVTEDHRNGTATDDVFLRIYDTGTCEMLAELVPRYPHSFYSSVSDDVEDRSEKIRSLFASLNDDESLLAVYGALREPSFFVYDMDDLSLLWHIGFDSGQHTDRIFDFAEGWEGYILPYCSFMNDGSRLLCVYAYTDEAFDEDGAAAHRAFEIREASTGEVLATYSVPYETRFFRSIPEHDLILMQDTDMAVHLVSAGDGREIACVEGGNEIYSYAVADDRVFILYKNSYRNTYESSGHELYYDGMTRSLPVSDMDLPLQTDGIFGTRPFMAGDDGIYDAETGTALMRWTKGHYIVIDSASDGSKLLCFAPYTSDNSTGDAVILKYADGAELRDIALEILNGRELTEEQKIRYHVE